MLNWKSPKQHGIEERKQRDVRAQPECQGKDDNHAKRRILAQEAKAIAKVLKKFFQPAHAARVAAFFLALLDSAQIEQGGAARFVGAEAIGDALFGSALEVIAQFLVQFILDCAPSKQRTNAERNDMEPAFETHAHASFKFMTATIAVERRSHWPASMLSCFRPILVSA